MDCAILDQDWQLSSFGDKAGFLQNEQLLNQNEVIFQKQFSAKHFDFTVSDNTSKDLTFRSEVSTKHSNPTLSDIECISNIYTVEHRQLQNVKKHMQKMTPWLAQGYFLLGNFVENALWGEYPSVCVLFQFCYFFTSLKNFGVFFKIFWKKSYILVAKRPFQ